MVRVYGKYQIWDHKKKRYVTKELKRKKSMKAGKTFQRKCRWYYYPSGHQAILQVYFGGKWMDTTVRKKRGRQ